MRRVWVVAVISLAACAAPVTANAPSGTPHPTAIPTASATPPSGSTAQDAIAGPGGMTLRQEIGAVMMVGFQGALSQAVVDDWRQHQFGGLILVPINQNAPDPAGIRRLMQSVRGVMAHPLLVATNQEGGTVCFPETQARCLAGARQVGPRGASAVQSEMTTMSQGLKALGFDINLAPVADVWDGVHPLMSERSYGRDAAAVAQDVTAAIAGIHAAGMDAAVQSLGADLPPLRAAAAAHVDLVMVGHLGMPALDASMSGSGLRTLRSGLGYPGVVISDDLEASSASSSQPSAAAVAFLENGGDMVIDSHSIEVADVTYDAIRAAVLDGSYPRGQLDASVQKLLNLGLRYMP
jgi:beta-N-acetylhexosaminidase